MGECRTCDYAKPHGWKNVYCTFFGINISMKYDRCNHHKREEEHDQNDSGGVPGEVRERVS